MKTMGYPTVYNHAGAAAESRYLVNPDTFLYFAYGSNLNPERIRQRIPDARPVGRATLKGWRLVERLYADIEKSRGSRVEGVLYLVTTTELHRLDAYEGYPTSTTASRWSSTRS